MISKINLATIFECHTVLESATNNTVLVCWVKALAECQDCIVADRLAISEHSFKQLFRQKVLFMFILLVIIRENNLTQFRKFLDETDNMDFVKEKLSIIPTKKQQISYTAQEKLRVITGILPCHYPLRKHPYYMSISNISLFGG